MSSHTSPPPSPSGHPRFEEQNFPFWRTLYGYFSENRKLLLIAVGLNLVAGLAITGQNILPKYLTDNVLLGDSSDKTKLLQAFGLMSAYIGITVFGRILFWHLSMRIFAKATTQALKQIRRRFFGHVHFLCLRFHQQKQSGELLSYLFGSPLNGIQQFMYQFVLMVPFSMFTLLSTLTLVSTWNPVMGGILFCALLLTGWVARRSSTRVKHLYHGYQELESLVSGRTSEILRGQKAVKMMGAESTVLGRFHADTESIGNMNYTVQVKSHLESIKSEIVQIFFYALLALAGTWLHIYGKISLGEVIATLASYSSIQPLVGVLFQCALSQGVAHAGLNRIESILRHQTSTPPSPTPGRAIPVRPEIRMRNLSFAYEDVSVLDGMSLTVPYGQKVALVGPSGSGKSTVISLLLRLYDPNKGHIELGGTDIRKFEINGLRQKFGVVPQDTFLFHASVRENILLATPSASEEQVIEALKRANAWEFVSALPLGMDTVLGEGGATLSGGQRQRIGIARALAQSPVVFIFDEATSALDSASEKIITDTLQNVLHEHTAFVIAHRLSTIRFCDRILVFDQGHIVQDGSYEELSQCEGLFQELLTTQNLITETR